MAESARLGGPEGRASIAQRSGLPALRRRRLGAQPRAHSPGLRRGKHHGAQDCAALLIREPDMLSVVGVSEKHDGAGDVVTREETMPEDPRCRGRDLVGLSAGQLAFLVEDCIDVLGQLNRLDQAATHRFAQRLQKVRVLELDSSDALSIGGCDSDSRIRGLGVLLVRVGWLVPVVCRVVMFSLV